MVMYDAMTCQFPEITLPKIRTATCAVTAQHRNVCLFTRRINGLAVRCGKTRPFRNCLT